MKHVPDLSIALSPSRVHACFAATALIATIALVSSLAMPWWGKSAAIVACAVAALLELRRARKLARLRITLTAERRIVVRDAGGHERRGDVLDATYVSGHYTSIVWRPEGSRFARVIAVAFDALPAEDARRMRVLLRYGRSNPVSSDAVEASASGWLRGDMVV
jgi:hypothetical protein